MADLGKWSDPDVKLIVPVRLCIIGHQHEGPVIGYEDLPRLYVYAVIVGQPVLSDGECQELAPAVIPELEGSAYITGRHEFLIDPVDPLRDGFIRR